MPDLNLTAIEPAYLNELTGYHEVSVSDDGLVKVRRKNGRWQSGMMGLCSWTEETIAKTHKPGVYTIKLPTPAEREQEALRAKETAAQAANEARVATLPNPWAKATWNLTQQLLLADQDPELTARFKREANAK